MTICYESYDDCPVTDFKFKIEEDGEENE